MAVAHNFAEKSRTEDVLISETVDFAGLLLSTPVLQGLKNSGFERPSPIQLKAIPLGRCGLDLIVQAKSGTGKTCVFSVIALESIQVTAPSTQVLVLAPTREIAIQIWEVINSIGSAMPGLQCHTFIGGMPLHEDKKKLQLCHIAVGSPGRIQNLIEHGCLKTDSIRLLVLDEADKLLEESFQEQINWIYSALPDNKQMLALSATYPEYLAEHLTVYMRNPTFIRLNISDPTLLGIKQYYTSVPSHPLPHRVFEAKTEAVVKLLSSVSFHQCLIFSNMQTRAQNLENELTSQGWPTTCIAGSLDQKERITAMAKLKSYKCRVLVTTDLTSRGIDADRVNLVINLDVPKDHETYLHRIGRAGRFGSYGAGVTVVSEGQEMMDMQTIERKISTHINPLPEPVPVDLVKHQLEVCLDDVVSTERLITRTEPACTQGSSHQDKDGAQLSQDCSVDGSAGDRSQQTVAESPEGEPQKTGGKVCPQPGNSTEDLQAKSLQVGEPDKTRACASQDSPVVGHRKDANKSSAQFFHTPTTAFPGDGTSEQLLTKTTLHSEEDKSAVEESEVNVIYPVSSSPQSSCGGLGEAGDSEPSLCSGENESPHENSRQVSDDGDFHGELQGDGKVESRTMFEQKNIEKSVSDKSVLRAEQRQFSPTRKEDSAAVTDAKGLVHSSCKDLSQECSVKLDYKNLSVKAAFSSATLNETLTHEGESRKTCLELCNDLASDIIQSAILTSEKECIGITRQNGCERDHSNGEICAKPKENTSPESANGACDTFDSQRKTGNSISEKDRENASDHFTRSIDVCDKVGSKDVPEPASVREKASVPKRYKAHSMAQAWSSMLAGPLFSQQTKSPEPGRSSSASSEDSTSRNQPRTPRREKSKRNTEKKTVSFENELEMYIKARSKLDKGESEEDCLDESLQRSTESAVKTRVLVKAKRRNEEKKSASFSARNEDSEPSADGKLRKQLISGAFKPVIEESDKTNGLPMKAEYALQNGHEVERENGDSTNDGLGDQPSSRIILQASGEEKTVEEERRTPFVLPTTDEHVKYRAELNQNGGSITSKNQGTNDSFPSSSALFAAPAISESVKSGTETRVSPVKYSTLLKDFQRCMENNTKPKVLTPQEIVQKSFRAPERAEEDQLLYVSSYLRHFYSQLRPKMKTVDNGELDQPEMLTGSREDSTVVVNSDCSVKDSIATVEHLSGTGISPTVENASVPVLPSSLENLHAQNPTDSNNSNSKSVSSIAVDVVKGTKNNKGTKSSARKPAFIGQRYRPMAVCGLATQSIFGLKESEEVKLEGENDIPGNHTEGKEVLGNIESGEVTKRGKSSSLKSLKHSGTQKQGPVSGLKHTGDGRPRSGDMQALRGCKTQNGATGNSLPESKNVTCESTTPSTSSVSSSSSEEKEQQVKDPICFQNYYADENITRGRRKKTASRPKEFAQRKEVSSKRAKPKSASARLPPVASNLQSGSPGERYQPSHQDTYCKANSSGSTLFPYYAVPYDYSLSSGLPYAQHQYPPPWYYASSHTLHPSQYYPYSQHFVSPRHTNPYQHAHPCCGYPQQMPCYNNNALPGWQAQQHGSYQNVYPTGRMQQGAFSHVQQKAKSRPKSAQELAEVQAERAKSMHNYIRQMAKFYAKCFKQD